VNYYILVYIDSISIGYSINWIR